MKTDNVWRIQSILNREWNPIGLTLTDHDDEYRAYAHDIAARQWHAQELCDYLIKAEAGNMGLPVDAARKAYVAQVAKNIIVAMAAA